MKQALDTRTKLLTKSPWPLMIELSIPAVLGMVVVGLYNMMDSIFVGQMVGDVQMGAISVSYPLTLINAGSAAMLGVGSASVLSRAIGKKDENTIKKIMGNLVAMVLLLSVIYTVVGMVFTRQLLSLTGASDNILNYAEKYLRISGKTVEELAEEVGTSRSTMYYKLNGGSDMSVEMAIKIKAALGAEESIEKLFARSDEPEKQEGEAHDAET